MHLGMQKWSRQPTQVQTEHLNINPGFTENGVGKRKDPVSGSTLGKNAVMKQ